MTEKKTKAPRIDSKDWRNRQIDTWNTLTFLAFITDETQRRFNVTYAPGGRGAVSSRWSMERGMLNAKKAQYGNAVLKRFIELALDDYRPTTDYPYVTFTFMISYRDRLFVTAQKAVSDEARAKKLAKNHVDITKLSAEEIDDIL
jgi:hypothetical protein